MSIYKFANSPDAEMEQSFFQLAFERLQEKLYNLLPYLVGFEIANKSNDGTKALGVFGFKSNNGQMLFVPAFFINGDVKGVDLMYSKNNEQFYPLNEDFAELFLRDEATGIGDASKESAKQINQTMPPVNMMDMVRPPRTAKVSYASVIDYVEQAEPVVKQAFYTMFRDNAEFQESVLRFYPLDKIAQAITPKVAKAKGKKFNCSSVSVLKDAKNVNAFNLSEDEKEELQTNGYIVLDKRRKEEKSEFGLVKYDETFVNPTDSGFYAYLTQSGSLRYALIITKPMQLDCHFPTDETIIIDLDAEKDGLGYFEKANKIFTRGRYELKDFSEVLKNMEEPAEVKPSYSDTYILVNEHLSATVPFRVKLNFKNDQGLRQIEVEPVRSSDYGSCCDGPYYREGMRNSYFQNKGSKKYKFNLILTKKPGNKLEYENDNILVPRGFKLMGVRFSPAELEPSPVAIEYNSEEYKKREEKREAARRAYEQGRPAGKSVIFGSLREKAVYPLTVHNNGSEYFLTVGDAKKKYNNAIEAKIGMVVDVGLGVKEAADLIESVYPMTSRKGYVKLAYTGDQSFGMWDPTAYSGVLGQPTYDGVGHSETMAPDVSYTQDPTRLGLGEMPQIEGLDGAINQANQLAQSGQKEIFDTHSIATLAKYVSPESKVTSYMPDFISCLDKLGRMLFLVHWETDKFEQMYGRSELPELVELLTNVFTNLGDLIIFLKRKSPQLSINMSEKEMDA